MVQAFANWMIRWRFLVILAAVSVVGMAASGVQHLSFKSDYRMFFSEDNPQLVAFEKLTKTFAKNDNVLFAVMPADRQVFTPATLSALERLTTLAWQIPYSTRVDSVTNFQYSYADGDTLSVRDLVEDAGHLTDEQVADIKATTLQEPLLVNRLIAPDGSVTGVNVTINMPGKDQGKEIPQVVTEARRIVEEIQASHPALQIYLTGSAMMDNAFAEAAERDGQTLIPLMLTLVVVMLWMLLRSFSATLLTVAIIALSIAGAMGLAGWLHIALSPTSVAAPDIILTLAVADCVHVLLGFLRRARAGTSKPSAVAESLSHNIRPVFLTSLTTAVGFLSMNFSDAPPFRDLGNITAMGVGFAFLLSVTLLPAAMSLLPVCARHPERHLSDVFMERFSGYLVRHRNAVFYGMGAMILGLMACIPSIELNDEFVKYFDKSIEFRRATDFANDHLTGIYYIDYQINSGEDGGISDPTFLAKVDELAEWFRRQPEALHVFSVTDIIKRLNRNMHGDDPSFYRLPDSRELTAQYLLIYEMSLPYGLDLNDRIDIDKAATRVTVTLKSLSSGKVLDLERRAQGWLAEHGFDGATSYGSGTTAMFAHIGQRNINTMLTGTVLALVLISVILIAALKSLRLGLISLIPNLVPAAMAFGFWGAVVGQVGLAVSVVAAMTLGIVVDDTVHFLTHYTRARRELELSPEESVSYAFQQVGMALVTTSLVLIAGFSVLAFSTFAVNASMGLLTAIAIFFALVADFFFLPTVLMKLEDRRNERKVVDWNASQPSLS